MGSRILILYSTVDGHTRKICERLQQVIESEGHEVTLASLDDHPAPELGAYGKIVIGASIRYGRHRANVIDFMKDHRSVLERRPSAFFSVNVVARKAGKDMPATNPYVRKFLKQISWRPRELAVFAGKINYPIYGFWDRAIIRFIMWVTGGPTERDAVVEFTDWRRVEAFGRAVGEM
ncbi:MAG: menaquinone-dependent protoporphyrinogen IX dehydrogenase [Betaproteobacteria bacterium]|nr:menaquinone-dependent protoporphyrinogen IX dehydrogenase [Betaproteobacteria bacterium]